MTDKLVIDCSTGDEESVPFTAEEEAQRTQDVQEAEAARTEQEQTVSNWRTQLQTFIDGAEADLAAWPPDLATNASSVSIVGRVNLVTGRTKNTRALVRLAKFIRDNVMDVAP